MLTESSHCHLLVLCKHLRRCFTFSFLLYVLWYGKGTTGQMCYKATTKKAEINTRGFASGSFFPRVHTKLFSLGTSPFLLLPTLAHTHFAHFVLF